MGNSWTPWLMTLVGILMVARSSAMLATDTEYQGWYWAGAIGGALIVLLARWEPTRSIDRA